MNYIIKPLDGLSPRYTERFEVYVNNSNYGTCIFDECFLNGWSNSDEDYLVKYSSKEAAIQGLINSVNSKLNKI